MSEAENILIKERARGNFAKQLFENPLWDEFFQMARDAYADVALTAEDPDVRERARIERKFLVSFEKNIRQVLITGKMAEMQLEKEDNG